MNSIKVSGVTGRDTISTIAEQLNSSHIPWQIPTEQTVLVIPFSFFARCHTGGDRFSYRQRRTQPIAYGFLTLSCTTGNCKIHIRQSLTILLY